MYMYICICIYVYMCIYCIFIYVKQKNDTMNSHIAIIQDQKQTISNCTEPFNRRASLALSPHLTPLFSRCQSLGLLYPEGLCWVTCLCLCFNCFQHLNLHPSISNQQNTIYPCYLSSMTSSPRSLSLFVIWHFVLNASCISSSLLLGSLSPYVMTYPSPETSSYLKVGLFRL